MRIDELMRLLPQMRELGVNEFTLTSDGTVSVKLGPLPTPEKPAPVDVQAATNEEEVGPDGLTPSQAALFYASSN